MSIFSDIFRSILGGIGESEEREADREATREAQREGGRQDRQTLGYQADLEYFYNQKLRHEKANALGSAYNQFSTVRAFAPGYVPGSGLDAMPTKPDPRNYDPDEEDNDD